MKHNDCIWLVILTILACGAAASQVTNLTINGSTTTFTMVSGDTVNWQYDVPAGTSTNGEIWVDLNGNSVIDTAIDKPLFLFKQTDGDTTGNGGPPDIDGLKNGHVIFEQRIGLAPATYILKFTQNGVGQSMVGTVTPLLSSTSTITGHVTPPPGKSAAHIFVEAKIQGHDNVFWDAMTNGGGAYTIEINADSAESHSNWRVGVLDNFSPNIAVPQDTTLILGSGAVNVNFHYLVPSAQVVGTVVDDNDQPLREMYVMLSTHTDSTYRASNTDFYGHYAIGLLASDLTGHSWYLETSDPYMYTTTALRGISFISTINPGDSLIRNLKIYSVNSSIRGVVRINGAVPNFPAWIQAVSTDTAQATTLADSATGTFLIPVSNKIAHYTLNINFIPFGLTYTPVVASAGDSDLVLNMVTTSVEERAPGIPAAFALHQNYPNPFNPATSITYDLPTATRVRLAIYNVLGEEVARLVEREQNPGRYSVSFDGTRFPSGVYFYRILAGTNAALQKMVLLK